MKRGINMMYELIRLVISIIILLTAYFVFKIIKKFLLKNKITNNKKSRKLVSYTKEKIVRKHFAAKILLVLFFYSFIAFILWYIPFENLFINFSSPEDVFKYTKQGEIDKIIYGENSCMIIYNNDNSQQTLFVRKDGDGYKIVTYMQYSKEYLVSKNYCSTHIYTLNQTGDTYSVGHLYNNTNDVKLSDNFDTEYYLTHINGNVYYFYGYLKDYNENYSLYINSTEAVFV